MGQLWVVSSTQTTDGSTVCLSLVRADCNARPSDHDWDGPHIYQSYKAEDLYSIPDQSWALTKYTVGGVTFLSTFSAYGTFHEAHNICTPVTLTYSASQQPCHKPTLFPVQGQYVLRQFIWHLSKKSFDCSIPGAAALCSQCLSFSQSITFSLLIDGETEFAGSRPRNGLLNPCLAKAST